MHIFWLFGPSELPTPCFLALQSPKRHIPISQSGSIVPLYILLLTNTLLISRVTIKSFICTASFLLLVSIAGTSYAQVPQIERDALAALYFLTLAAEAGNSNARQELQLNLGWTENKVSTQSDTIYKCTSFGLNEGSEGHANCIMELQMKKAALAQARRLSGKAHHEINQGLDEIEDTREKNAGISATQRPAAVARKNAARRYQEQQQRERKAEVRQRAFKRALLGISSILLNFRTPSNYGSMFQTCN